jgi:uncharacterized membrane protein
MDRLPALLAVLISFNASLGVPAGSAGGEPGGEGAPAGALEGGRAPEGRNGRDLATPDGLWWMDDSRLSDSAADEAYPALAVDSYCYAHLTYFRQGKLFLLKAVRPGSIVMEEKYLADAVFPAQPCGQPGERLGVDGQDNLNLIYMSGGTGRPQYLKFSSNGNQLNQPIDLTVGSSPESFGLGAGRNHQAYISYLNWDHDRAEMEYIDNNFNVHQGYIAGSDAKGVTIGLNQEGYPYIFYKHNMYDGLWMSVFTPDGKLHQSSRKIDTPVLRNGWFAPLPSLAFGSDGAVHLLQASAASGLRTLFYTKLAPDGTKLTNDMVVTNSSGDFGDICVDSTRHVYIAWGNASDGELHYVRIEPNKENATLLPQRLTSSNGTNRDPQLVIDGQDGLHVAWVSNRTGNMEVFYKCSYRFGAELGMTPDEMAKIMYVHLNETKSANITVRNMGGLNDTIYLGLEVDFFGKPGGVGRNYTGPGFKVWIDELYKELDLETQEMVKLPVYVRGSSTAGPNEYIKVSIWATSLMNPSRNETVQFRVYTLVDHRIALKCWEKVHTASAGVPTHYTITVINIGDVEEAIDLSARGPPAWNYSLDLDRVRLRPGEETGVVLSVTPPADACEDDVGIVEVRGTCSNYPSRFSEVRTTTVVSVLMWIEIRPERAELSLLPGGTEACWVTVAAHGIFGGAMQFLISASVGAAGWNASFDAASVTLRNEEEGMAVLRVSAPPGAPAGSRAEVRLLCYDPEERYFSERNVTAVVERVRGLDINVTPGEATVVPGGTAVFNIALSNTGNAPDEAAGWGFTVPPGWYLSLQLPNGKPLEGAWSLELDPGERAEVVAVVEAPAGALAGTYIVPGWFLDGVGEPRGLQLEAAVVPVRHATLFSPSPTLHGSPGGTLRFPLVLYNAGNQRERFELACRDLPDGWGAPAILDRESVPVSTAVVGAHSSQNFTLVLRIPDRTRLAFAGLNVSAGAAGLGITAGLSVVLEYPDLAIASLASSVAYPRPGELVYVNVTVQNRGTAPAFGASLAFFRNKEAVIEREMGDLGPGESRLESFIWIPKEGQNVLVFIVDPEDTVPEANETGNTALMKRYVSGPLPAPPDRSGWLVAGAVAVPAAGVTVAALRLLARPRRRR